MLFHLFLLVLIIYTLFFFYTDVMNKINTNKPFAEGMTNAGTDSEELRGDKDSGYRGNQNKTRSGKTCQKWTSQSPHNHSRTDENFPNKGLGDHNFCRNPDGESTIWCYTMDPSKRWEFCDPLPPAPATASGVAATCEDKIPGCDVHKANGGCLDANPQHDAWRTSCVKTCGYCDDPKYNPVSVVGKLVTYQMITDKPDFCGTDGMKSTKMEWYGEVCEGGKIKWNSMKSLAGTTRPGYPAGCSWNREGKSDAWITKYVGSCGVSPTYVSLPTTVTELQSKKGSIGEFDYWRKKL